MFSRYVEVLTHSYRAAQAAFGSKLEGLPRNLGLHGVAFCFLSLVFLWIVALCIY